MLTMKMQFIEVLVERQICHFLNNLNLREKGNKLIASTDYFKSRISSLDSAGGKKMNSVKFSRRKLDFKRRVLFNELP